MKFDFIDMIVNTGDEYLTGVFYKRRPATPEDGGVTFKYKQLDPNARVFGKVLGEVRKDRATYAIKTNDDCAFNIGGYIQTQNGLVWEITEVIANEEVQGGNEALRWFRMAKNAEISVRMIQVDDLYNLNDTYDTSCVLSVTSKRVISKAVVSVDGSDTTENVGGYTYECTVNRGASVKIELTLEDGTKKKIAATENKTVVSRLEYKI